MYLAAKPKFTRRSAIPFVVNFYIYSIKYQLRRSTQPLASTTILLMTEINVKTTKTGKLVKSIADAKFSINDIEIAILSLNKTSKFKNQFELKFTDQPSIQISPDGLMRQGMTVTDKKDGIIWKYRLHSWYNILGIGKTRHFDSGHTKFKIVDEGDKLHVILGEKRVAKYSMIYSSVFKQPTYKINIFSDHYFRPLLGCAVTFILSVELHGKIDNSIA